MTPAVLEPDTGADVVERQVVVQDLPAERDDDDEPGGECAAEDQEPRKTDRGDFGERLAVEPDWLAPLGQWYGFSRFRPDVLGLRADEAVVLALFEHVCGPARGA